MTVPLNKITNQIRLSKSSLKKLKDGDEEALEKVCRPENKYAEGFMVCAGMSSKGVGNLIFWVGKVNSFVYK